MEGCPFPELHEESYVSVRIYMTTGLPEIMHVKLRGVRMHSAPGRGKECNHVVHARHIGLLFFTTMDVGKGAVCQDRAYLGRAQVGGWVHGEYPKGYARNLPPTRQHPSAVRDCPWLYAEHWWRWMHLRRCMRAECREVSQHLSAVEHIAAAKGRIAARQ